MDASLKFEKKNMEFGCSDTLFLSYSLFLFFTDFE